MLVGVGLIVVGLLLILFGVKKNRRCSCKTIGRITGVHEYEESDKDGFHYYSYSPEFEFVVNGQTYHGYGGPTYKKRKRIQIGGSIVIYYNPKDPEERFPKGSKKTQPIIGAAVIFLGVIFLVISWNG